MQELLTYLCPFCEREARVGKPCPGCAKKAAPRKRTWQQDPAPDGIDLPGDDFDYQEYVAREFGKAPHRRTGLKWYWWLLGVAVLSGMIFGIFR